MLPAPRCTVAVAHRTKLQSLRTTVQEITIQILTIDVQLSFHEQTCIGTSYQNLAYNDVGVCTGNYNPCGRRVQQVVYRPAVAKLARYSFSKRSQGRESTTKKSWHFLCPWQHLHTVGTTKSARNNCTSNLLHNETSGNGISVLLQSSTSTFGPSQ